MKEQKTHFYSDGYRLEASFFLPDVSDQHKPILVINSGYTGLKHIHPERYARNLTPHGYTCFGFDYRGFSKSEGIPNYVLLEDQVRDITNAVQFVADHHEGKGKGIVLVGWGMAGGLILEASRLTPKLEGLVSLNGFYDADRVQRALRGEKGYSEFRQWLHQKRSKAIAQKELDILQPFDIYPLDPVSRKYVNEELYKAKDYDKAAGGATIAFADSLLRFAPERNLSHLASTPIFIGHGDKNELHPVEEAKSLHAKYPGPKELYWIPNAGHTEWMLDENPIFQGLVKRLEEWLRKL